MAWKHLTRDDRLKIKALLHVNTSVPDIAAEVGVSVRTIYREIKRGQCQQLDYRTYKMFWRYSADFAQNDYDKHNFSVKGRPLTLINDALLVKHLDDYIGKKHYSPAAALREIDLQQLDITRISTSTAYRYIYFGYLKVRAIDLPVGRYRPHGNYVKYTAKKHKEDKSIAQRPVEVKTRAIVGDWEMDTVIGKAAGPSRCLLVLTERKTRYEIVMLMQSKTVREVASCLHHIRQQYGDDFKTVFRSITCDNGCEFDTAALLEQYAPIYYCHPYSSWERGSNENQNKLIRRFCPKGKSMEQVTSTQAEYITLWMNNYPRKLLGWQRPADLFAAELKKLGVKNIPA